MQKVRVPINSFQYGEISDSLLMRTDSAVYSASAQSLQNMIVLPQGGVKRRHGFKFGFNANFVTGAAANKKIRLFSWVTGEPVTVSNTLSSDTNRYVIGIGHGYIAFPFSTNTLGAQILTQDVDSNALPFDEDDLHEYNITRYGDIVIICHNKFAPRILTRKASTTQSGTFNFEISVFSFSQRADNKVTFQPYSTFQDSGVTLDPSATSGNGITLTTSAAYFDTTGSQSGGNYASSKHVGTIIRYHGDEITITSVQSSTQATGNVNETLDVRLSVANPLRTTNGSATVEVTHINHGFQGGEAIVISNAVAVGNINANQINGSRTIDANIIDENTYSFTAGSNATSSEDGGGNVEISSHAPSPNFDEQSWSAVRGYPAAVTFHQNRLVFAGTLAEPDSIYFSKIGSFFNFDVGDAADDDAIQVTAALGEINPIRYLVSNRDLQIFTGSAELYIPTFQNQPLTPTNLQIRKQTPYGCEFVTPTPIDGATLFVERGGRTVREYLFTDNESAYTSTAISTIASHLINTPIDMAVSNSSFNTSESYAAFVMTDGTIALFNSNRAEKRASWTKISSNFGSFDAVTALGNVIYATIKDSDGNYYYGSFENTTSFEIGLDGWREFSISGNQIDVSSVAGQPWGNGDTVTVLAKDSDDTQLSHLGTFAISGNAINLSAYSAFNYTTAYIGSAFTSKIITNPIDASMGNGPATGEIRGLTNIVVDFKDTRSAKVNSRPLVTTSAFSGKKEFRLLGYNRTAQITIEQDHPLPLQVNGLVAELVV